MLIFTLWRFLQAKTAQKVDAANVSYIFARIYARLCFCVVFYCAFVCWNDKRNV